MVDMWHQPRSAARLLKDPSLAAACRLRSGTRRSPTRLDVIDASSRLATLLASVFHCINGRWRDEAEVCCRSLCGRRCRQERIEVTWGCINQRGHGLAEGKGGQQQSEAEKDRGSCNRHCSCTAFPFFVNMRPVKKKSHGSCRESKQKFCLPIRNVEHIVWPHRNSLKKKKEQQKREQSEGERILFHMNPINPKNTEITTAGNDDAHQHQTTPRSFAKEALSKVESEAITMR